MIFSQLSTNIEPKLSTLATGIACTRLRDDVDLLYNEHKWEEMYGGAEDAGSNNNVDDIIHVVVDVVFNNFNNNHNKFHINIYLNNVFNILDTCCINADNNLDSPCRYVAYQCSGRGHVHGRCTRDFDYSAPAPTSESFSSAASSASEIAAASTATTTTTGSGQRESSEAGAGLTNGAQNTNTGSAISTQTTVAVAGGVIGGLALLSVIAFLFWFWRKRLMKKRRSTLLTPLSTGAAYRGGEKGPYVISRNSLGPTTIPEKVRAMVGYNYHRLRGRVNSLVTRSPKPSVDLNRGNSQFGLPDTPAIRSASRAVADNTEAMTTKAKFVDWWGRLTEDGNLNWKLRNDPKNGRPNNDTYTSRPGLAQTRKRSSQPDFLTLLSMDEKQQQQGANTNTTGGSSSSSNPRRSQSLGNDHFLGGLGLNFDTENPFADSNVMSHNSAKCRQYAANEWCHIGSHT
ncbi:hypothetical protein ONZ43_g6206 [Nemania bipapillata]|uniref:Uncharacterized protein n=1 Tax=Nemania bipapillata TaxID=110536 RepID=A0ACC2I1F1_9PEZI|nr:hypothetical protein ONZ43_g6206 [Nemania bipapillata]